MPFPVTKITRPAMLEGLTNGRIPANQLVLITSLSGGPEIRLIEPAARAWKAMRAAAKAAGFDLNATSVADSFRAYAIQERIFKDRYTTKRLPGRPTKKWNGVTYWQKPGTAVAAVPGTSNHGWAMAVDTVVFDALIRWLRANAHTFGWSWELQSEPWHLHYFAGDDIPAAVLAYEQHHTNDEEDPMAEYADQLDAIQALATQAADKGAANEERLERLERRVGTDNDGRDLADEMDAVIKGIRVLLVAGGHDPKTVGL